MSHGGPRSTVLNLHNAEWSATSTGECTQLRSGRVHTGEIEGSSSSSATGPTAETREMQLSRTELRGLAETLKSYEYGTSSWPGSRSAWSAARRGWRGPAAFHMATTKLIGG
eukprot:CAMPEP_0174748592 /NCGR_PEP_ID=MMETSP1094-20130205/93839_1 /TAXON_ID=156173 /ORGANISM="Chrysochromulina brevifilum, Strain UTEX LB 985" /LENGTH=111 /DNA_ID=CAMNT_0015953659 /DNA_START=276 /DNA_END=608 /DNA_ORIENTATION=-